MVLLWFTCEGFELVLQVKLLSPQGAQVHPETGADGELFQGSADLVDLVGHCLLSGPYTQCERLLTLCFYYHSITAFIVQVY